MSFLSHINTVNEQAGVLASHGFDTRPENMHILYYIARNQLYSDELMALIREYGINGMDIHIATGQPDRPIRITLPTQLDSFLRIRDFGTGLDDAGIQDYVSFGESGKRGDPLQTGQLGIGCKCGFTYGDSFIVTSYQGGKATVWNAYIDPSNKGKIDCMAVMDTTEPDGIEVCIPIRPNDIDKCREKLILFCTYVKVVPEIINFRNCDKAQLDVARSRASLYQGTDWRYFGKGVTSVVIMGNIAYPIDTDNFTDIELTSETRQLLEGGLVIEVPMDSVDFAASRERLKYTPRTKQYLSARLNEITEELLKMCSATFGRCPSLWEAKLMYKKVFDFGSSLYPLRGLFCKSVAFNGFRVSDENFPCAIQNGGELDVVCWCYSKHYRGKIRREQVYHIPANEKHFVAINDTGIVNGIMNRIVGLLEDYQGVCAKYSKVYILSFANDAVRLQWVNETGFDGPAVALATLPKEPMSKYYGSTGGSNGSYHNAKHSSKEFKFDGSHCGSRYGSNRSKYWEVADVDLDEDEGVYVEIERFNYRYDGSCGYCHPYAFKEMLQSLSAAGLDVPEIYGFKAGSVEKAKKNPKMVPFLTWLKSAVTEFLANNPDIEEQVANREYAMSTLNELFCSINEFAHAISKWNQLPDQHPLRVFADKIKVIYNWCPKAERLVSLARRVNVKLTRLPTYDVATEYLALKAQYPILFRVAMTTSSCFFSTWEKDMSEYIMMVDLVTPATGNQQPTEAPTETAESN